MIPKIVHLLWLGEKPVPSDYLHNFDKWCELAKGTDWIVKIHRESNCIMPALRRMLHQQEADIVQIVDIMRYAVVYAEGGFYADMDIIPNRLPDFFTEDRLNLFWDRDGEGKMTLTNATFAAPKRCNHVRDLFFKAVDKINFSPRSKEAFLTSGADIFKHFPTEWFNDTAIHSFNYFSFVSWPSARALRHVDKFTYGDWCNLAEEFSPHDFFYGLHTFDSSWVYILNDRILKEKANR